MLDLGIVERLRRARGPREAMLGVRSTQGHLLSLRRSIFAPIGKLDTCRSESLNRYKNLPQLVGSVG
jgi:hypothetical protein